MSLTKETLDASVHDRQFRSDLLKGVLSGQAEAILKSSYRCEPPTGPPDETTEYFNEKGLVLWSIELEPPKPIDGKGPQISCRSDRQQIVLFESGELATVRTRHYSGSNNVYTWGVGEDIERNEVDKTPLTGAELEDQRTRISEELWRRVCAIGGE